MLIILPILILVIVLTALVVIYVLLVKATYGHLYGNFASTLTAKSRQAAPAPVSVVDVVEPIETSSIEDDISDDTKESEPEKEAYVSAFADDSCESDDETETQESEYLPLN